MKKLIAFLICISLFLTGCGASTAETQPEATEATPTTVATEAPTEATTSPVEAQNEDSIAIGNLMFPVGEGQTIEEVDENTTRITYPGNTAAVGIFCDKPSESLDSLREYMPKMQHTGIVSGLVGEGGKASDQASCTILGASVGVDLLMGSNGLIWIVGTFDDGEYIYTIMYGFSSTASASEQGEQFAEFANGITTEKESLEITSVK
jgi:hypothetical protein